METIEVIIYGCGIMGRKVAKALQEKQTIDVVGAVDIDPGLAGKDLGELFEPAKKTGIIIENDADALFSRVDADTVVLTTSSHLKTVFPQIKRCLESGMNIVSTCEELSFPWKRSPDLSQKIDALAKTSGLTVVGTGINPGYLMDSLPLTLTAPCLQVNSIRVTRMMNSARRRIPFQKKVGTSLSQEEFHKKIQDKIITGHVGLLESINMIAAGLGWEIEEATELPPEPVTAQEETETGLGPVHPGDVIGLKSVAYARREGREAITLEFIAHAGVVEEYDEIVIQGIPKIHEKIIGGVHGDLGTVAMTINTIPEAIKAQPGLKVMSELPAPNAVL